MRVAGALAGQKGANQARLQGDVVSASYFNSQLRNEPSR
jgi:hypothetical protein